MLFIAPVNEIFYEFKNLLLWETILKIILLGDGSVGKTAFYSGFFSRPFDNMYMMTIGCDQRNKYLKIDNKIIPIMSHIQISDFFILIEFP